MKRLWQSLFVLSLVIGTSVIALPAKPMPASYKTMMQAIEKNQLDTVNQLIQQHIDLRMSAAGHGDQIMNTYQASGCKAS